jgi:hypothetical protein
MGLVDNLMTNEEQTRSERATPSDEEPRSIFCNIPLPIPTTRFAEKIKSPELIPIVRAFVQNGDNIGDLLAMPLTIMTAGLRDSFKNLDFIRAATITDTFGPDLDKYGLDPDITNKINDEMSRIWNEETEPKFIAARRKLTMSVLYMPSLSGGVRVLLLSCVVTAWTTFESLASDLWVQLVSSRTATLGRQVASHVAKNSRDYGRDKSEPVVHLRDLSRHDFDIRPCLGEILAAKFDFTKLSGIRRAYQALFPNDTQIRDALKVKDLQLLQGYRHSIVHKGGIVDDRFRETTGLTGCIKGQFIPQQEDIVVRLIGSAFHAGEQLLLSADLWLSEHPL